MRKAGWLRWWWLLILFSTGGWAAQGEGLVGGENPGYHPPPAWFKESFLDIPEEVEAATEEGRRLLLYFYQDGCPYCARLLTDNFGDRAIAEKTQAAFDVIAVNIWGDREVTTRGGSVTTEKAYAADLKVMYTPTLLFLDEQGESVLRLNGYYPPHRFSAALDYAAGRAPAGMGLAEYIDQSAPEPASGELHSHDAFLAPPYDLSRQRVAGQRPLLVLFEQRRCHGCDELHRAVLGLEEARGALDRFDVVRLDRLADTPVVTPAGERSSAQRWAQALGVQYAPSLIFFDERGREIFRAEAYLKRFHLLAVLDYIASGAYREQPNFQRFVQARAEAMRERGEPVDLWE